MMTIKYADVLAASNAKDADGDAIKFRVQSIVSGALTKDGQKVVVGSTTLGFGWSTGYIYFTLARQRRVVFSGKLQPWVGGKDIVLELLRRWGAKQSQGMSVELVDADSQLPMAYRNTIANMMAEAEALNGVFAADELTYGWYRRKGIVDLPYPRVGPGAGLEGVLNAIEKRFS